VPGLLHRGKTALTFLLIFVAYRMKLSDIASGSWRRVLAREGRPLQAPKKRAPAERC